MKSSSMFTSRISTIPDYQQQSGQKKFDINPYLQHLNVQKTTNMFANNPFQRTFASVVSCKPPLMQKQESASKKGLRHSDGILNTFFKKIVSQKRTMLPPKVPYFESSSHVQKEFEDFKTLPSYLQNHNNNNNNNCYQRTASKSNSHTMHNAKNRHEKGRHSIEHDIRVDCDIFNKKMNRTNNQSVQRNSNSKRSTENLPKMESKNPPFEIFSLEEFPAIPVATTKASHDQICPRTPASTSSACSSHNRMHVTTECDESDYVKYQDDIAKITPSFIPRRLNLCEKVTNIVKSPTKLLSIPMISPKRSCLKPQRRRTVSECSDDFIVFDRSCCEENNTLDSEIEDFDESDDSDDDGVPESDNEDLEDEDDADGNILENSSEEIHFESHQPDSGMEERKVRILFIFIVTHMTIFSFSF